MSMLALRGTARVFVDRHCPRTMGLRTH